MSFSPTSINSLPICTWGNYFRFATVELGKKVILECSEEVIWKCNKLNKLHSKPIMKMPAHWRVYNNKTI